MSSINDAKKSNLGYFKYNPLHNQQIIQNNEGNLETIVEICAPLTEELKIPYFIYRAFFHNNKVIYLTNSQRWANARFAQSTHHNSVFRNKIHLDDPENKEKLKIFIWANGDREDSVYSLLHEMEMWNGLSLYREVPNCLESYHFAGTPDDYHLVDFMLSNLGLLKRFIYYFQEKASSLITEDKAFNINYVHPDENIIRSQSDKQVSITNFFNKTNLKKFHVKVNEKVYELSKREAQCFSYLGQGRTAKEIAQLLNLSPRTVETYIEHIKIKVNILCKSKFIDKYDESFLDYYFKSQENQLTHE